MFHVDLQSEVHGVDRFDYGTLGEAQAGFTRVKENAEVAYRRDSIPRTVTLVYREARIGELSE